jgi:hypothetical protein
MKAVPPTVRTQLAARIEFSVRLTAYLLFDSDTSILLCLVVCAFGS